MIPGTAPTLSAARNQKGDNLTQWIGSFRDRIPLSEFNNQEEGLIAGLAVFGSTQWRLHDHSGSIVISHPHVVKQLPLQQSVWLALRYHAGEPNIVYIQIRHVKDEQERLWSKRNQLTSRWQIARALRTFFLKQGFMEVETPARVLTPAIEPFLEAIPSADQWLRTSPELHMKRLLAAGFEPIFQLAPAFRDEPRGRTHREEFQMLEWYRVFADLQTIIDDVGGLLAALADYAADPEWFRQDIEVLSVKQLFWQRLKLDLGNRQDKSILTGYCEENQIHHQEDDSWDDLFFRIMLGKLESGLGTERPLILTDYPASQCALAKCAEVQEDKFPTCHRFELYMRGIECANAFYELVDPVEQEKRIHQAQKERTHLQRPIFPTDKSFLAALDSGLPPSAGIALGFDRLVMVLLGQSSIDEVTPF